MYLVSMPWGEQHEKRNWLIATKNHQLSKLSFSPNFNPMKKSAYVTKAPQTLGKELTADFSVSPASSVEGKSLEFTGPVQSQIHEAAVDTHRDYVQGSRQCVYGHLAASLELERGCPSSLNRY